MTTTSATYPGTPRSQTLPASFAEASWYAGPPRAIDTLAVQGKRHLAQTLGYTTAGLGVTAVAGTATAACLPPLGLVAGVGVLAGSMACMVGAMEVDASRVILKHACWLGLTAGMGVMLSGLAFVSTAVLANAAILTCGVAGALTGAALLMPAGSFRSWEGPLVASLLGLCVVSTATACLPASCALAASQQMQVWVGLAIFGGFLLYDTSDIARRANATGFDPLRESVSLYLDVMNLFVRLVDVVGNNA